MECILKLIPTEFSDGFDISVDMKGWKTRITIHFWIEQKYGLVVSFTQLESSKEESG